MTAERLELWLEDIRQHACTGDVQTPCVDSHAPGRNQNRAMSDSSVAPPAAARQRRPPRRPKTDEDVPIDNLSRLRLSQSASIPSLPPPPVVADFPPSLPDCELQSTTSAPISATRPTTYSAAGSSQKGSRSRSPVKSPLDLRFTTKPLRYEPSLPAVSATSSTLSDVDKLLLRDLKKIATGQGTIPRSVQDEVEDVLRELDEVASWMLRDDDEDGNILLSLRREFDDVKDLVARSIECDVIMEMSEAAWKTGVHMPLLHLALRESPVVGAYNITTARPCRELLPKSIETKGAASGGTNELEARSQLLQWTSAWLTRMRRFLHARSVDQIEADTAMAKLGFPVIIVSCSTWHLYLIKDSSAAVTMYSILELGDTHSVLGIYKLLSSVRRLAVWAKGPFWSWFKQEILAFQAPEMLQPS